MEKIYIAGPMSGVPDHNKSAFLKAEQYLISFYGKEKVKIFNPINHEASLMVQRGLIRDTKEAYRLCMAMDCEFICRHATMIFMLNGWENSKGAMAEWTLAKCLGIRIVYE
jgi:hypothetical protein